MTSFQPKRWLVAAAVAGALAVPLVTKDGYIIQLLNIAILNTIVVLGLNFVTGWAGQINFGQAAFYGLGAYAPPHRSRWVLGVAVIVSSINTLVTPGSPALSVIP